MSKFQYGNTQKAQRSAQQLQSKAKSRESSTKFKLNRQNIVRKNHFDLHDKYVFGDKIGEGSFGEVFKVTHRQLKLVRALKIIKKTDESLTSHNSYDELEILKRLDHPNVLKVYEYFQTETQWFIITEYFQGKQLFEEIVSQKKLTERKAALIFAEVCKAVAYIHAHSISHRDIKPENILVSKQLVKSNGKQSQQYSIKLIDWGLGSTTIKEMMRKCGTPEYCAPQILQGSYGSECDLWSLGVLLYVMLIGRFPFKGRNVQETLYLSNKAKLTFKSDEWAEISIEAKYLLSQLIVKQPKLRLKAADVLKSDWIIYHMEKERGQKSVEELKHDERQLEKTLMRLRQVTIDNKFQAVVINFIHNYISSSEKQQKLKKQFELLDENHDGVLSYEQLLKGYHKIYSHWSHSKLEDIVTEIFRNMDMDGSKEIEYSEFVTFATKIDKKFSQKQLKQVFKLLDQDGNGKINKKQINQILLYEKGAQGKNFDLVIDQIDLQSQRSISLEQFIKSVNKAVEKVIKKQRSSQKTFKQLQKNQEKVQQKQQISLLIQKKNIFPQLNHKVQSQCQPGLAQMYAEVILKIAEFPKAETLKQLSLVDQIYEILKQKSQSSQMNYNIIKNELDQLFVTGIQYNHKVFNQQRIGEGKKKKQQKIVFNPTFLVTGQIFRQLIFNKDFCYCISYGHRGIAKTFSYFLYQMLSKLFLKQIIKKKKEYLQFLYSKLKIQSIPKLFYWSMNTQKDISYIDVIDIFLAQCQEISNAKKEEIVNKSKAYQKIELKLKFILQQICYFYKGHFIQVYLIIDQINQISSVLRQGYKDLKFKQSQRYKITQKLNQTRQFVILNQIFKYVIYNSSVNNQILFHANQFGLKNNKQFFQKIKKKIQLKPQQDHSGTSCFQFRILYPEIIKLESTAWQISDMIMFELKKYIDLKDTETINNLRKKIFDFVIQDQGKTIFSYLSIRKTMELNYNLLKSDYQKGIKKIIKKIKQEQNKQLKKNYQQFESKILDARQRLMAKTVLLDSMIEKKINKNSQNNCFKELNSILKQKGKQIIEILFANQIQLNTNKIFIFQNLDRNLFISFKEQYQFVNFIKKLLDYLLPSYSIILQEDKKKQQMINEFIQTLSQSLFKNDQTHSLGFSLLQYDQITQLIQESISQFYQLKRQQIKEILDNICQKNSRVAYGIFLEKVFIDFLQNVNDSFDLIHTSFKNSVPGNIFSMKVLPKLYKSKQNPAKYNNVKGIKQRNSQFLVQFLVKQSGHYLYKPVSKTSKAIDFAILISSINAKVQIYEVHLFQVTLRTVKQQIEKKIQGFMEAQSLLDQALNQMEQIRKIKQSCQKQKKKFQFKICYWLMGDEININQIQQQVQEYNKKLIATSCLKQLYSLNFNVLNFNKNSQCNRAENFLVILQEKLKYTRGYQIE